LSRPEPRKLSGLSRPLSVVPAATKVAAKTTLSQPQPSSSRRTRPARSGFGMGPAFSRTFRARCLCRPAADRSPSPFGRGPGVWTFPVILNFQFSISAFSRAGCGGKGV
jgi:hypothetical protein